MYSIENSDMYTFDKEPERSLNFADLVTDEDIKMLQIVIEDHSKVSILTKILETPPLTCDGDVYPVENHGRKQMHGDHDRSRKVKGYLA